MVRYPGAKSSDGAPGPADEPAFGTSPSDVPAAAAPEPPAPEPASEPAAGDRAWGPGGEPASEPTTWVAEPSSRRRWLVGGGVVVGAVVLALVAVLVVRGLGPPPPPPEELAADVAGRYLSAWGEGDVRAMARLVHRAPADFADVHTGVTDGLAITSARYRPGVVDLDEDEEAGTVPFTAELELDGLGSWSYDGELSVALVPPAAAGGGGAEEAGEPVWQVRWDHATVHPQLTPDRRLVQARTLPERAPLLAVDGTPLTGEGAPELRGATFGLLGSVRELDEEEAAEREGRAPGDEAGVSGLQAAFDERLGGTASGAVELVEGDEVVEVLHEVPGVPGEPVRTTIDVWVQANAEDALPADRTAALVAVDVATGEVRAVVSRPLGGFNRAVVGAYPPGSTFKVVTSTALLAGGLDPDAPVGCPETASVGGRSFKNAEGEVLGEVPFRTAFFRSCNTAFVDLSSRLEPGALVRAAEGYGFGRDWELPVPLPSGSVPEPGSPVDLAAAAIGQGQVTASPLQMAVVAASVAAGEFRVPQVVVPDEPVAGEPLPDGVAPVLQGLMREVVAQGTGTAAAVPGEPVAGKTGTAEYGTESPPRTHAWFIGFRAGTAVAVLVEDGGFGGEVAAPIAADFFARLG